MWEVPDGPEVGNPGQEKSEGTMNLYRVWGAAQVCRLKARERPAGSTEAIPRVPLYSWVRTGRNAGSQSAVSPAGSARVKGPSTVPSEELGGHTRFPLGS